MHVQQSLDLLGACCRAIRAGLSWSTRLPWSGGGRSWRRSGSGRIRRCCGEALQLRAPAVGIEPGHGASCWRDGGWAACTSGELVGRVHHSSTCPNPAYSCRMVQEASLREHQQQQQPAASSKGGKAGKAGAGNGAAGGKAATPKSPKQAAGDARSAPGTPGKAKGASAAAAAAAGSGGRVITVAVAAVRNKGHSSQPASPPPPPPPVAAKSPAPKVAAAVAAASAAQPAKAAAGPSPTGSGSSAGSMAAAAAAAQAGHQCEMRVISYYGDWRCFCGAANRLWDTCACGQIPPCRWAEGQPGAAGWAVAI